jgi:hypothetical protein
VAELVIATNGLDHHSNNKHRKSDCVVWSLAVALVFFSADHASSSKHAEVAPSPGLLRPQRRAGNRLRGCFFHLFQQFFGLFLRFCILQVTQIIFRPPISIAFLFHQSSKTTAAQQQAGFFFKVLPQTIRCPDRKTVPILRWFFLKHFFQLLAIILICLGRPPFSWQIGLPVNPFFSPELMPVVDGRHAHHLLLRHRFGSVL